MIGHYFNAALQAFRKAPITTAANIVTLALGLACVIGAFGIGAYWRSADGYHVNAARTFAMMQGFIGKNDKTPVQLKMFGSAAPARFYKQDFPQIETVARVHPQAMASVAAGEKKALFNTAFADPGFLEMFDFDFIAGDPRRALTRPDGVVLTQDAATRLFGDRPALGQPVLIDQTRQAVVTGVIGPIRAPSFMGSGPDSVLRFDMLATWSLDPSGPEFDNSDAWFNLTGSTFVMLKPGASVAALNRDLAAFVKRHMPPGQNGVEVRLVAEPLNHIITGSLDNLLFGANGLGLTVNSVLIAFGVLTLIVAGVNFANLATAQAAARAKQIGLRKVLGASRTAIMAQAWLETFLQTLAALFVALGLLAAAAPLVRRAMAVDVLYFLTLGAAPFVLIAGLVLVVALIAGAYPALVLSGARPIQALQSGRSRSGSPWVARILVAVQFATASFLVVLLTVTLMQRAYLETVALAPKQDPLVVLSDLTKAGVGYDALAGALAQSSAITGVTVSDRLPWGFGYASLPLVLSPQAGARETNGILKHVGYDYFSTMGLALLAGRAFDREHETAPLTFAPVDPTGRTTLALDRVMSGSFDPTRPIPLVADQAMIEALGFATPQAAVGKTLYLPLTVVKMLGGTAARPVQVIGVVETEVTHVGAVPTKGSYYFFGPISPFNSGLYPIVRLSRNDVRGGVSAVQRAWDQAAPGVAVDIQFYDQLFEQSYRQYDRISQLFVLLAAITLIIAAIGQLAMAVHIAGRRRHEIAVRKTLGSTTLQAVGLLLADFSKPVIVGCLIAWPFAYWAANALLKAFSQRIDITPWPFALSLVVTLVIAWLAVASQTIGAARVSPAKVLRDQ